MKHPNRKDFEKQLRDGGNELPIHLLQSRDKDELKAAWVETRSLLLQGEDPELGVTTVDGERVTPGQLMNELQSLPFFQKRLIVRVTQAEKLKKECQETLIDYLGNPCPGIFVVLEASGLRSNTRLYKSCDERGVILDIPEEKPWEKEKRLQAWLQKEAKSEGYQLQGDAAATLVQQIGGDCELLKKELEKLICYVGDRKEIKSADLAAVSTAVPQESIWELGNAVFAKQPAKAIAAAASLLNQGLALQMLLRSLRKQFQNEFQICSIIYHGGTPAEVSKAFPYMRGKILEQHIRQAHSYGMERFRRAILLIDKAELASKNSDISAENCLFPLLANL